MSFVDLEESIHLQQTQALQNDHIQRCIMCYKYRKSARLYCLIDFLFSFLFLFIFHQPLFFIILVLSYIGYYGTTYYNKFYTMIFIVYLFTFNLFKFIYSCYYIIDNFNQLQDNHVLIPTLCINSLTIAVYVIIFKVFMKYYITLNDDVVNSLKNNNVISSYNTIVYW